MAGFAQATAKPLPRKAGQGRLDANPCPPTAVIYPDETLSEHAPSIEKAIDRAARNLTPEQFKSLVGDPGLSILRSAKEAVGADSITIWLADVEQKHLVVTHSDPEERLVGWEQPVTEGLISLTFASEQCLCENKVYLNADHSKRVDEKLGHVTTAMIATPFYIAGNLRGVFSCVQLKSDRDAEDPPGFSAKNMNRIRRLSTVGERLVNYRLLTTLLGLEL